MTLTEYTNKVTELLDPAGLFEFPGDFEDEVKICFQLRQTLEEAVAAIRASAALARELDEEFRLEELERMVAECGDELPEGLDTPRKLAQALLASKDPPRGADLTLCTRIAEGY